MTKRTSPKVLANVSAVAPYRNPNLPAARRAKDLLARMTLEEKAAQMVCIWQQKQEKLLDDQGRLDPEKAKAAFRKGHGLGQVGRPSDSGSPPGEAWKGQTGRGMADVLFGDINPGGKLPISIPRSVGHLSVFYNHKPSARRGYLWDDVSALFAFGFGLSYTTFKLDNVRLSKKRISREGSTRVLVDVTNTGKLSGTEVVQMYIRDCVSSVTRPVKELKGLQKVWLEPGEKTTVTLEISAEALAFYDAHMHYVVEPGDFEIMIGTSSRDSDLQKHVLTVHS